MQNEAYKCMILPRQQSIPFPKRMGRRVMKSAMQVIWATSRQTAMGMQRERLRMKKSSSLGRPVFWVYVSSSHLPSYLYEHLHSLSFFLSSKLIKMCILSERSWYIPAPMIWVKAVMSRAKLQETRVADLLVVSLVLRTEGAYSFLSEVLRCV